MAHVRTQIRKRVMARLIGLQTTAAQVFSGRTRQLAEGHTPALLVYTVDEQSDVHASGANAILGRTLTLAVEGRVTKTGANAAADLEDALDQIALEVEPVVVGDPTLGGLATEVTLIATRISALAPGSRHEGEIRMEFRVFYRTAETAPAVAV